MPRYPRHQYQHGAYQSRNGPARQRRRERRTESRALAAAKAVKDLSEEEARVLELAEEAANNSGDINISENQKNSSNTVEVTENPTDELYPDDDYEAEEVDEDEIARNKLVEKILVYPVTEPI